VFIVLVILSGLSLIALIAGFIWQLSRGNVRRTSGPEVRSQKPEARTHPRPGCAVGAGVGEETAQVGEIAEEDEAPVGQATTESSGTAEHAADVFKGRDIKIEREAETSLSAIKAAVRAGRWREALPGLLLAGGLTGLLLFGALVLFTSLDRYGKLLGLAAVAIALYVTATEVRDYLRA